MNSVLDTSAHCNLTAVVPQSLRGWPQTESAPPMSSHRVRRDVKPDKTGWQAVLSAALSSCQSRKACQCNVVVKRHFGQGDPVDLSVASTETFNAIRQP